MADVMSEAERNALASEGYAAIEAALDRRCPEAKTAFWSAVDRLYRRDAGRGRQPRAVLDVAGVAHDAQSSA